MPEGNSLFFEYMGKLSGLLPAHKDFFRSIVVDRTYCDLEGKYTHTVCADAAQGEREVILRRVSSDPDLGGCSNDCARKIFLYLVASKLKHRDLARWFHDGLEAYYRDVAIEEKDDHSLVRYTSIDINPESSIFSATLKDNWFLFLADGKVKGEVKLEKSKVGEYFVYSKNSPDCFNKLNVVGMLFLSPAFQHATTLYMKALGIRPKKVIQIIDVLNPGEDMQSYELKRKLVMLPLGDGAGFEKICLSLLEFMFSHTQVKLKVRGQVANYSGTRRRDFIMDNIHPKHPFFKVLKSKGVEYVLFDAKNYEDGMSTSDLDTFFSYIQEQPKFGKFGVILSRSGLKDNAESHVIMRMIRGHDEVVVLNEKDLISMIDRYALGRDPVSVLEEKLTALQLKL